MLWLPLLAITGILAWYSWSIARDDRQLREDLQATNANVFATAQQLDALFNELLKRLPQNRELAESDQLELRTWLRFDEKFLAENANRPDSRFETAVVHRRIGHASLLLRDVRRAKEEFQRSIKLLEELSREQPTVSSFVAENAETHIRLGWALRQSGAFAEAADTFRQAGKLVAGGRLAQDPGFLPVPGLDPQVIDIHVYDSLADWAWQQGGVDEAVSYRERIVEILRRLTAQFPDVAGYAGSLNAAQTKLDTLRLQARQRSSGSPPDSTPVPRQKRTDGRVED